MKKEEEAKNPEEQRISQQKKNREKIAIHKKKIESSKVDALIDKLFREPETIASDFIPFTIPKYTGNSSPSENQSSEAQITDFDEHRLFSDFFHLPREHPRQMVATKSSSKKNHQEIEEIMKISRSREFGDQDYELLLSLDQQVSRGLEDHELRNMRFWQIRKKVKKEETVKNQLGDFNMSAKKEGAEIVAGSFHEKNIEDPDEIELECHICFNKIKHGQMARELPCGHIFHKKCIDRWLKDECYCPLDKKDIRELLNNSKKAP